MIDQYLKHVLRTEDPEITNIESSWLRKGLLSGYRNHMNGAIFEARNCQNWLFLKIWIDNIFLIFLEQKVVQFLAAEMDKMVNKSCIAEPKTVQGFLTTLMPEKKEEKHPLQP